jgi:hypothetical protein
MTSPGDREPEGLEVVTLGVPARLRGRWLGRLALAGLVDAAVTVVVIRPNDHRPPPVPVTLTRLGHPILGIRADWELLGLDHRGLVQVRFARGQVLCTRLPQLHGDGIASLVAGPRETLVRPSTM